MIDYPKTWKVMSIFKKDLQVHGERYPTLHLDKHKNS